MFGVLNVAMKLHPNVAVVSNTILATPCRRHGILGSAREQLLVFGFDVMLHSSGCLSADYSRTTGYLEMIALTMSVNLDSNFQK